MIKLMNIAHCITGFAVKQIYILLMIGVEVPHSIIGGPQLTMTINTTSVYHDLNYYKEL
jgi:hypothetical protein